MAFQRKRIKSIVPIYSTTTPNSPISLYAGNFEFEQDTVKFSTNGEIEFVWLRTPKIAFYFSQKSPSKDNSILVKNDLAYLKIPSYTNEIQVKIIKNSNPQNLKGKSLFCSGEIAAPFQIGNGNDLQYLILHLPNFFDTFGEGVQGNINENFSWAGRFYLYSNDWKITVDKVETYQSIFKELEENGGYAITHVIKIERENNNTFNISEIQILKENLFYFFSFARGFWIEPTLEVGFDVSGNRVWETWTNFRTDRWRNVNSWFNCHKPSTLTDFFPVFCEHLEDPMWGEILKRAIRWYISSNLREGEEEGSIILAQTAHEMLSWTKFVTEKGLSPDGYKNLHASDKLRLILSEAKIPLDVSVNLKYLLAHCKSKNWVDGAQAVTEIRNKLVHPSPKNLQVIQQINANEMFDAYSLTMWYLELTLLFLLGYKDQYVNRLIYSKWAGETEEIPWT